MNYNVIPPLIQEESKRLAKEYKTDNNTRMIIDLVARSKKVRLIDDKNSNVPKFIISYFLEIQVALSLYYKGCADKIVEQLTSDDIYKGTRIKYAGGSLLGSDVYKIIDKVGGK